MMIINLQVYSLTGRDPGRIPRERTAKNVPSSPAIARSSSFNSSASNQRRTPTSNDRPNDKPSATQTKPLASKSTAIMPKNSNESAQKTGTVSTELVWQLRKEADSG